MAKKYTQEEFEDKVHLLFDNTIDLSNFTYVNSQTKGHCKCNICGYEWDVMPYSLLAGHGCRKCYDKRNSSKRLQSIEEVNSRIHDTGNSVSIIGEYVNTKTKCLVKCDECNHVWRTVPNQLYFGHGCPKCNNSWTKRRKTTEKFINEMKQLYNDEYEYKIETKFVRTRDFIKYICPVHGEIEQLSYTHSKGNGCPLCKESGLEKRIRLTLERKNINFKQWYNDKWLGLQSLDFYLPDINIAIEVQGSQHFEPNNFFGGVEGFKRQIVLDAKKKEICKANNVTLLYYVEDKYYNCIDDKDIVFTNESDLLCHISKILKELNNLAEGKIEITEKDIEFTETEDETIE